ncbi:Putative_zinc finger in N-recognin (UBR box) and ring finger domain-containing protein [Hexamita inflata]|uniref:Zinc finger in N-recognin (UBR box) and ring finger domain-containing protein n=1 Tax=Hexamita inflata TaxID=28002 RepID=A0AA86RNF0_9EUKA|nr:Putative zinc finger in N-recognin (UBR box) and ring finger domain-containing protein [Hexamita inflata]
MCYTCGTSNSILCDKCFLNALPEHKGHNVRCVTGYTGLCDCGDVSAYESSAFCCDHKYVEPTNLPENSPSVLKYFFDFISTDFESFKYNYELSTSIQLEFFETMNFDELNEIQNLGLDDVLQEQLEQIKTQLKQEKNQIRIDKFNKDPVILRISALAFLFSGENISIEELFELQKDFNKIISYKFELNPNSLMGLYLTKDIESDFYHNYLTQDFLFRMILPRIYECFSTLNTKFVPSLCHSFAQSLAEPLAQFNYIDQNIIELFLQNTISCLETNNFELLQQFSYIQLQNSSLSVSSMLFHRNSGNIFKLIANLQSICQTSVRYYPEKEYKNQQQIIEPVNMFLEQYLGCVHGWSYFIGYLDIKQNLSYETLVKCKIHEQLDVKESYNGFNIQQIDQFVKDQPNHFENLTQLVKYYHENKYFIKDNVCIFPVYILQIYLVRMCEIFRLNPQHLIEQLLQQANIDLTVKQFISLLFIEWIKTIVFTQIIGSGQFFKRNLYDLSMIMSYLEMNNSFKQIKQFIVNAMQVLLPYNDQAFLEIYNTVLSYKKEDFQHNNIQQVFIQLLNMLMFTPNAHETQEQLKFEISTNYSGQSYFNLLQTDLKSNYQIQNIEEVFKELVTVQIIHELKEPLYSLKTLDYVEPVLSVLNQETIINKYSENQAQQLARIINSKKISNQFCDQLQNNIFILQIIKELGSKDISTSDQISCFRISLLYNSKIEFKSINPILLKISNLMFDSQAKVEQLKRLNPRERFALLKHNQKLDTLNNANNSQETPKLMKDDEKEQQIEPRNISEHICDLCHQEIQDAVYYLCSSLNSVVDDLSYQQLNNNLEEQLDISAQVLRTCGHKFHEKCCNKHCPVCQKYFQKSLLLYLTKEAFQQKICNEDYLITQYCISTYCKNIYGTLTALASDSLIFESDRKIALNLYANESNILLNCYRAMCTFMNVEDLTFSIPELYGDRLKMFKKQQKPIIDINILKNSVFEYMHDVQKSTCSTCSQQFCLDSKPASRILTCLKCGWSFHISCSHGCSHIRYSFFDNVISTDSYGVIGFYKNAFQGLQKSCVGPELFINQNLLSQIVVCLITSEANLQKDQSWVAYVNEAEDTNVEIEIQE